MRTFIYHPVFHPFQGNHFQPHYYLGHPWRHRSWGDAVNWVAFGKIGFHDGWGLFVFFAILVAVLVFFLALGRSERPADKEK